MPGEKGYLGWKSVVGGVEIPYGLFIGEIVNFLVVALALFIFIVKFLGWIMKSKKEEARRPAPPPTREEELLAEIRDLLKKLSRPWNRARRMYFGQKNGFEASAFLAHTENEDTGYPSGTQAHVDGPVAQHFPLLAASRAPACPRTTIVVTDAVDPVNARGRTVKTQAVEEIPAQKDVCTLFGEHGM